MIFGGIFETLLLLLLLPLIFGAPLGILTSVEPDNCGFGLVFDDLRPEQTGLGAEFFIAGILFFLVELVFVDPKSKLKSLSIIQNQTTQNTNF